MPESVRGRTNYYDLLPIFRLLNQIVLTFDPMGSNVSTIIKSMTYNSTRRYRADAQSDRTALGYVLEGLIPFTEANMKLAFSPNRFFDELDRIRGKKYKRQSVRNAYYSARRAGLIEIGDDGIPRLTERGRMRVTPYQPGRLAGGAQLFVIFDIPEAERRKRLRFRRVLRELGFQQVQKSVWTTSLDHRRYLRAEIEYSDLGEYVQIYEAVRLV